MQPGPGSQCPAISTQWLQTLPKQLGDHWTGSQDITITQKTVTFLYNDQMATKSNTSCYNTMLANAVSNKILEQA